MVESVKGGMKRTGTWMLDRAGVELRNVELINSGDVFLWFCYTRKDVD